MKKRILAILLLTATWSLPACSAPQPASQAAEEISAKQDTDLTQVTALLGMKDADAADLFGGSLENFTEDGKTYLGRIYTLSFYGQDITLYTTCNDDSIVDSVSAHLFDGETALSEKTVQHWIEQITAFVGSSPAYAESPADANSKSWKWNADGYFITLRQMEDALTLALNPAVGELK